MRRRTFKNKIISYYPRGGARLRYDSRHRSPAHAPIPLREKQPIEKHVRRPSDENRRHCYDRPALGAHEIIYPERNLVEDQPAYDYGIIRAGVGENFRGRPEERQYLRHKRKHGGRGNRGKNAEQKHRLPQKLLGGLPPAGSEAYRNHRGAPVADSHGNRQQKQGRGKTYRNGRKRVLAAGAPYEYAVGDVVGGVDNG